MTTKRQKKTAGTKPANSDAKVPLRLVLALLVVIVMICLFWARVIP